VGLSAALVATLALAACGQKAVEDPRLADPLVRTLVVGQASDAGDVLTGVVHARFETDLAFRAGGKIAERLVDPGAHVRKGQVLMRLDPSDYALAASAADAQYLAAKAQADRAV
jgi:multidrug efflux pump subunit AcrA (membrane-fusion protein)